MPVDRALRQANVLKFLVDISINFLNTIPQTSVALFFSYHTTNAD